MIKIKGNGYIHIIAGPTASGKSARALDLAREKEGVIINADSLQIYDALPVLTAQPSAEDLAAASHKLYSHLPANGAACSAGQWSRLATAAITETLEEGRTPILCGGTGFYLQSITQGLSPMPNIPPDIRAQAETLMAEIGVQALHAKLEAADPLMKGRFHPNHSARILRAWEVLQATGKSLAYWQDQPTIPPPADWVFEIEYILPERKTLYERCNARLVNMIEEMGALDEVAAFATRIDAGEIAEDAPVTRALGFTPLRQHLAGEIPLEHAITQSQQDTRNYAKKQMTWFRNQTI